MLWSVDLLGTAGKEAAIFTAIGLGIAVVSAVLRVSTVDAVLGFVLLIEATGLMIIGGALDLSGTGSARLAMKQVRSLFGGRGAQTDDPLFAPGERKKTQMTAAKYSLTGVLLFVEAFVLALVLY